MNQYEIAAEMTGVEWRRSFSGGNDWQRGVVYFKDRRQTKRGLYEFLNLAYGARYGEGGPPRWLYIYRRAKWVQQMAADMHRRLPRSLFEIDRAQVREGLSKESRWLESDEVEAARKWARRT